MGNLVNTLRQLIREEIAFNESSQGRLGKGLGVDTEKASKIKQLYPKEHIIYKIIDTIENPGDKVITRLGYKDPSTGEFVDGLMQMFGFKSPQMLNAYLIELVKSGIIFDKDTAIPKREKPESTGQRGRKPSDRSKEGVIRILFQKWQENPDFTPTEEETTYDIPKGLGTEKIAPEILAKIKSKALGLSKRGRPSSGKDDLLSKVEKNLQKESLSEMYRKLQKI